MKKKIILTLALIAAIGMCVYGVMYLTQDDSPRSPYPQVEQAGNFAVADPEAGDIFENEEYLDLDRNLYLKIGAEEYAVFPGDEELDEGAEFFFAYFDAIANGDCELYNTMFSDIYYETFLPQEEFTQQMIYDKHIELISRTEDGENLTLVYYVDYKIHRNNGTFRTDILHDATRTLRFDLSGKAGELRIDAISY